MNEDGRVNASAELRLRFMEGHEEGERIHLNISTDKRLGSLSVTVDGRRQTAPDGGWSSEWEAGFDMTKQEAVLLYQFLGFALSSMSD